MKRLIVLLALFALFLPGLAQANPMKLTVEYKAQGAGAFSLIDEVFDVGDTGSLSYFNDAVGGGVIVNFTTGDSYPPLIDPTVLARLLLHSTNIENTATEAAGSVRVTLSRSYFAVGQALASAAATITVDGLATASLQSWVSPNSGGSGSIALYTPTFTVVGSDTQHIDGATHLFASGASPFSLVSQLTVDFAGAGVAYTTDASTAVTEVPEPASMFLIGSGLLGLVSAKRRHSKRNESASV